jgi:hypothetical protein
MKVAREIVKHCYTIVCQLVRTVYVLVVVSFIQIELSEAQGGSFSER